MGLHLRQDPRTQPWTSAVSDYGRMKDVELEGLIELRHALRKS